MIRLSESARKPASLYFGESEPFTRGRAKSQELWAGCPHPADRAPRKLKLRGEGTTPTTKPDLAVTIQLVFKSAVITKALKGGAACPQAAADGSVVRQPLGDKRLHPYCIVTA